MLSFENALVYAEGEGIKKRSISFDDKIRSLDRAEGQTLPLPEGAMIVPGFIDEHVHGAGGADAMDGTREALFTIANTLAKEGTTGFLATTMTQSKQAILTAMHAVKAYMATPNEAGARLLGVHLEGPFISAAHKGAQPLEYVVPPDIALFEEYNGASGNAVKIVTLAPEVEGAQQLIGYLFGHKIVPSVGHTGAKYEDIARAVAAGAKNVTHTYNAQSALHHREIGTVGSAMLIDELNCELIADTVHVSVPAMRLLVKNKRREKLTLITDAMRAKGLKDGASELGGQTVYVKDGQARLADGTLAGSVLKMNEAISNMVQKAGLEPTQAIDCATATPAKTLGIYEETGSIRLGKRADITVLDRDFQVLYTVCGGKLVYRQ